MDTFHMIIAAIVLAYISFSIGHSIGKAQRTRLEQENRRLKRMLNDLRCVDEISFQALCAMAREAVNSGAGTWPRRP